MPTLIEQAYIDAEEAARKARKARQWREWLADDGIHGDLTLAMKGELAEMFAPDDTPMGLGIGDQRASRAEQEDLHAAGELLAEKWETP